MTVYATWSSSAGTVIQAGTNDIRIIGMSGYNNNQTATNGFFRLYASGSISGTTLIPTPTRPGSPATTASVRVGPGDAATGTYQSIDMFAINSSASTFGTVVWQPMGDLILPTGAIFQAYGAPPNETIWFEELRLSWSY